MPQGSPISHLISHLVSHHISHPISHLISHLSCQCQIAAKNTYRPRHPIGRRKVPASGAACRLRSQQNCFGEGGPSSVSLWDVGMDARPGRHSATETVLSLLMCMGVRMESSVRAIDAINS